MTSKKGRKKRNVFDFRNSSCCFNCNASLLWDVLPCPPKPEDKSSNSKSLNCALWSPSYYCLLTGRSLRTLERGEKEEIIPLIMALEDQFLVPWFQDSNRGDDNLIWVHGSEISLMKCEILWFGIVQVWHFFNDGFQHPWPPEPRSQKYVQYTQKHTQTYKYTHAGPF